MSYLAPISRDKWLENSPRTSRRRRKSGGRGPRRSARKRKPPPGGWKKYMESIRPNSKGGAVKTNRRRRRRNPTAANPRRRRRRNPATTAVATNPRRRRRRNPVRAAANPRRRRRRNPAFLANRRRRRYSRNPRLSVRGLLSQAKTAATTAVQIVGGKVATRVIRNYIPNGKPVPGQPLSPVQILIELGAATAVGYLAGMFLGPRVGANMMAGGFVGVVESLVKTYKVPVAADALGDDGDPNVINVPAHMSGYVQDAIRQNPELAGYVEGGGGEPAGAEELEFAGYGG